MELLDMEFNKYVCIHDPTTIMFVTFFVGRREEKRNLYNFLFD